MDTCQYMKELGDIASLCCHENPQKLWKLTKKYPILKVYQLPWLPVNKDSFNFVIF